MYVCIYRLPFCATSHIQDEYFQPFDLPDGVMLDPDPHCDHITRKGVICFSVEGNYMGQGNLRL